MTSDTKIHNSSMLDEELYLRALELFERRHELTDDELEELAASPAMQDAMLDLMDLGEAVEQEDTAMEKENRKAAVIPMVFRWAAAACVAVVIGFFAWNHYISSPATEEHIVATNDMLSEGMVFVEQDNSKGVTLACMDGSHVTPALQSSGTSVVADFTALKAAEAQEVRMDVPAGYDATITLPDGSVAYLHPGSRLKFPTKFVGETRQVILEGECYFKVTHDAAHPFVVSANNVLTTVLGTEFNVSTENANGTVVTLINGSVRVNDTHTDANMVIVPGQQVTMKNNRFVARNVDTSVYEAWRDGFFCYDNMPMSEVMEAIGRNYNKTVQFANRDAMHIPVRFMCERGSSLDDALTLINSLKRVSVRLQDGIIIVE